MSIDYRDFLKKAYEEKQTRNPRYSLRAFARDLEISSSQMVDVLNGKQGLSPGTAAKVADRLGWKPALREKFCALVQAQHGRSQVQRNAAQVKLQKSRFKKISEDLFTYISDWYHIAILELIALPAAPFQTSQIADRLQISEAQAQAALERMQRLGLIQAENSRWILLNPDAETFDDIPSKAIRHYHEQILAKSQAAIQMDVTERELQSLIFSCPKEKLPELRRRIRDFCADFNADKSLAPNQVYALNIQLFPLSQEPQ